MSIFILFFQDEATDDSDSTPSKILVTFNFCPQPLDKNNIIKINLETLDNNTLKNVLLEAISIFNNSSENIKITDKTEKYRIKIGKKSGMPDLDVPCK